MNLRSLLDELDKLGAVSDDQANAALERLDTLERQKATAGQVARYGALGGATGAAIGGVRNAISGTKNNWRAAAGNAVAGAVSAGALPVLQKHFDRKVEEGTLKKYIAENDTKEAAAAQMGVGTPSSSAPMGAQPKAPKTVATVQKPVRAKAGTPPVPGAAPSGVRQLGTLPNAPTSGGVAFNNGLANFKPPPMEGVPQMPKLGKATKAKEKDSETDWVTYGPGDFKKAKLSSFFKEAFKLHGHTKHQGLEIAIENRKGSVRKGVDKDGKPWRTEMKHPYGYIKGSKGADGEEVDCYVGPVGDAPEAHVVHQRKEDGKTYDEDKVMLGFGSKEEAREAYLKHYNDPKFLGPIKSVPIERLKELVESGKKLMKIAALPGAKKFSKPNAVGMSGASIEQVAKPMGFGRRGMPGTSKGGIS